MSYHESSECMPLLLNDDKDDTLTEEEPDQLEAINRNRTTVHLEPDVIVQIEDNCDTDTPRTHCETVSRMNIVQRRLLQTKESHDLTPNLRLTDDKEAHFFISYSSEDRSTVIPIVAELEETHKIACILDERDFKPGMHIHDNIKRSMEKSMKVLLFLSKSFLQSSYCSHESNLAFVMSMKAGRNIVIPIKLEECEVPSVLETLTYIDVNTENLADRIIEAYNKADTDCLPTDFDTVRRLENGYSILLPTETENACFLRPKRNRTVLDEKTMNILKIGKFQVSRDTIQAAVDIINSYKTSGIWSRLNFKVHISMAVGMWLFSVLGLSLAWGIIGATVYNRHPSQKTVDVQNDYEQAMMVGLVLGPIVIFFGMIGYYRQIRTTLEIVRYDVKPCKTYLARKIKEIMEKSGDLYEYTMDDFEEKADCLIRLHLFAYMNEAVPDAPENRHNVKGGKSCFCQILEPSIEQYVNALPAPPAPDLTTDMNELKDIS